MLLGFLFAVHGLSATRAATSPQLDVAFADDASFTVTLGGSLWFESGALRLFATGAWQHLIHIGTSHFNGSDALGDFVCVNVSWTWGDAMASSLLHTSLNLYSASNMAVFVQELPYGAANTNASNPVLPGGLRVMDPGNYAPIVSFPSMRGGQLEALGYVTWQSRMVNVEWGTNVTQGPTGENEPLLKGRGLQGLSTSGPVVLYDSEAEFTSVVLAPLDNFKNAVHYVHTTEQAGATIRSWETGVSSEVTDLPAGFEHRTLLVAGRGITATLDAWGCAARTVHHTNRSLANDDLNVEYLSYWTDNGAYYSGGAWGEAGGGGEAVNETAFRSVAADLKEKDLLSAIHIWQLDDWWYHTSTGGVYSACVSNWSLPEATFPSGLKRLSKALETPWLLYVPFWCPDNVYSKQFRWIYSYNPEHTELVFAEPHPDDAAAFYSNLFAYGVSNGMVGFEHDYLDYNFLSMPYLRSTYGAANQWLAGMNQAAAERSIPVQMCMALPSDLMASLAYSSVTNYRASTDYGISDNRDSTPLQPHDSNFNIGGASLLGFALGLRPSKDILWTHRPDNCRGDDPSADPKACGRWSVHTNPGLNNELNTIVATLSTGPVSLADKAGDTNATLVKRCIRADGRILQPDKPATAIDSMFVNPKANPTKDSRTAPVGFVWATSTVMRHSGASLVWHYILSIDVTVPWNIHGSDLYPKMESRDKMDESRDNDGFRGGGAGGSGDGDGWVALQWFDGHVPRVCTSGMRALVSGCVAARVQLAGDIPTLHNTRPIMVQNDTRVFDLMQLAPVVHGWALLGEVGPYVKVSRDRFVDVAITPSGIQTVLTGSDGETIQIAALQPTADTLQGGTESGNADFLVQVKTVTFGKRGNATLLFTV